MSFLKKLIGANALCGMKKSEKIKRKENRANSGENNINN